MRFEAYRETDNVFFLKERSYAAVVVIVETVNQAREIFGKSD